MLLKPSFPVVNYVLKTYSNEELDQAIARAKAQIKPSKERLNILKETLIAPEKKPNKISLHTLDKIIIVNLQCIRVFIKTDGGYLMLKMEKMFPFQFVKKLRLSRF